MKNQYHISTIANLLLDMDYTVEDHFFSDHNIEKGLQTLVDQAHMQTVLNALEARTPTIAAGGACTNAVYAAACLGANTFVNGRIGNSDASGQILIKSLESAGIQSPPIDQLEADGDTGRCLVLVSPDAQRTMLTHLGVSDNIPFSNVDMSAIESSDYFLVEGFQCTSDTSRKTSKQAMQLAKKAGTHIALSLCDEAVVTYFRDQIQELLNATPIDLLFCNQIEALALIGTSSIDEVIEGLKQKAARFVMTKGPDGACAWDGSTLVSVTGHRVEAKDTTGAGDTFVGTFLWALIQHCSFAQALEFSNLVSSRVVCKYGPRLSGEDLRQLWSDFSRSPSTSTRIEANAMG